jgi:hypothetical protein
MKTEATTKEAVPMKRVLNSKATIWWFLNDAKVLAVKRGLTKDQLVSLKQECDSLFHQATGSLCHPAWWIGGWGA